MKRHRSSQRKNARTGINREVEYYSRGVKLLPYAIREDLPILGSTQHLRGEAKAITKCFTVDGALSWYITEGSAKRNSQGKATDYLLYGLVEGEHRKLDYFWLCDLVTFRSPAGIPVERDAHWQPRTLQQIAPELFKNHRESNQDTSKPV